MPAIHQSITKGKNSDQLGRYYTHGDIGELLVDNIDIEVPHAVLDLGSGVGALSTAVAHRWSATHIVTVDVDEAASLQLKNKLYRLGTGQHAHIQIDALNPHLPELIRNKLSQIDAAVCNPPFIQIFWKDYFHTILKEVGFEDCLPKNKKKVDASLLFLAQNLRALDNNAYLGIILPDGFISSQRYKKFRNNLLKKYNVEAVIKLPRGSFSGTDALASIVVIKKTPPTTNTLPLYKLTIDRKLSTPIIVSLKAAANRLDYDYHQSSSSHLVSNSTLTLADISIDVRRGTIQNAIAKKENLSVLHTTSLQKQDFGAWIHIPKHEINSPFVGKIIAESGDILVARVGRNLHKKICGIATGQVEITDCIYRIRVPRRYQSMILQQLTSLSAQEWFKANSYGVGARQLTKKDLLSFPISSLLNL